MAWIAEQITQVTLLAWNTEDSSDAATVTADLQASREANSAPLVTAALRLFERVGADLAERDAGGFTL